MTGLNLETFLHLLRADLGAWATLGLIGLVLALMTWTSWGSRRALRKCLVLSIAAHLGLVLYGSTLPVLLLALQPKDRDVASRERIRRIRVAPLVEAEGRPAKGTRPGRRGRRADAWDRQAEALALAESRTTAPRPGLERTELAQGKTDPKPPKPAGTPEVDAPLSTAPEPAPAAESNDPSPPPAEVAPANAREIAAPVVSARDEAEAESSPLDRVEARPVAGRAGPKPRRAEPGRAAIALPETRPADALPAIESPLPALGARPTALAGPGPDAGVHPDATSSRPRPSGDPATSGVSRRVVIRPEPTLDAPALPETDVRRQFRRDRVPAPSSTASPHLAEALGPLALSRATPGGLPKLPEIQGAVGGRPLDDVPEVYRSRLDPNRSVLAEHAGASPASEQAVERALDWLARHQDNDGRWDGGIARYADGTPVKGDDDYTVHCPPGETCTGECIYWEADTALTGLALLAYLGSGYTHTDGKYTETVGRGIDFLCNVQKPDGDLRGSSKAVGMYCHAMATLALCEAYALTGDERLRPPAGRAVDFLVRARARDAMSWRYAPGADRGDTSILGWVVMALKSAKVVGIPVPGPVQGGTLRWLEKVALGKDRGLASYQPGQPATPTMTAEAWVCRQFLGVGGPGASSTEAARELLAHAPDRPGRDAYNLYYWYYGTLAMFQHGGDAWTRWNAGVRDQVVRRQRVDGHHAGSWDPDDSDYGAKGGRIYCTALATLTLEVYYRFLRLYDEPNPSPLPPPANTQQFGNAPVRDRASIR